MIVLTLTADGRVTSAPAWPHIDDEAPLPDKGPALVSLARWRAEAAAGRGRDLGVVLGQEDAIPDDLPPVVALAFPTFTDGRAYSLARRLRRAGYRGELRAFGDVLIDQMRFMTRVGFTAFEVPDSLDVAAVEAALGLYPGAYQPAADALSPFAWRRQAAGRTAP